MTQVVELLLITKQGVYFGWLIWGQITVIYNV